MQTNQEAFDLNEDAKLIAKIQNTKKEQRNQRRFPPGEKKV